MIENPDLPLEIFRRCHSFRDIAISGFRPLLQSPVDTFFESSYSRKPQISRWNFSTVSLGFRGINISHFGISGCRSLLESIGIFLRARRVWSRTLVYRWNFDDIYFRRYTYEISIVL